jgi:hypothetical protein
MKEFFDVLGSVEGSRLAGYTIMVVVIIGVTLNGIAEIISAARKNK